MKRMLSAINLKILNVSMWTVAALAYILPFSYDGKVQLAGFPFAFLKLYGGTDGSLFNSFHINAGALAVDIAVMYALIMFALKISEKTKDRRSLPEVKR